MRFIDDMVRAACGTKQQQSITPDDFKAVTTDDFIDGFLSVGDYRIVPDQSGPDQDACDVPHQQQDDEMIISEELAEVYMRQGLTEKAQEIYNKLQDS